MIDLSMIKNRLIELESIANSPVFSVSIKIVEYLTKHENQNRVTLGGLKAALAIPKEDESILVESAFMLTMHPFEVLDVEYKLYDASLTIIIEVFDKNTYASALESGELLIDGEPIKLDTVQSNLFPSFINLANSKRKLMGSLYEK